MPPLTRKLSQQSTFIGSWIQVAKILVHQSNCVCSHALESDTTAMNNPPAMDCRIPALSRHPSLDGTWASELQLIMRCHTFYIIRSRKSFAGEETVSIHGGRFIYQLKLYREWSVMMDTRKGFTIRLFNARVLYPRVICYACFPSTVFSSGFFSLQDCVPITHTVFSVTTPPWAVRIR